MAKVNGSLFPLQNLSPLNDHFFLSHNSREGKEMAFEMGSKGERERLRLGLMLEKDQKWRVLVRSRTYT